MKRRWRKKMGSIRTRVIVKKMLLCKNVRTTSLQLVPCVSNLVAPLLSDMPFTALACLIVNANGQLDVPLARVIAESGVAAVASSTASMVSSVEPPCRHIPLLHLPVYKKKQVEAPWRASCLPKTHRICSCSCDLLCSLRGLLRSLWGLHDLIYSLCGLLCSIDSDPIMMYRKNAKRDCLQTSKIAGRRTPFIGWMEDRRSDHQLFGKALIRCYNILSLLIMSIIPSFPSIDTHHLHWTHDVISHSILAWEPMYIEGMFRMKDRMSKRLIIVNDLWIVTLS